MANKRRNSKRQLISPGRPVADLICVKPTPKAISAENGIIPARRTVGTKHVESGRNSRIGDRGPVLLPKSLVFDESKDSALPFADRKETGTAYHERHGHAIVQPRREISAEKLVLLLLLLLAVACWLTLRAG